jgi:hypothetical protein
MYDKPLLLGGRFFTTTSLVDTFLVATFLAGAFFTTTSW